MMNRRPIVAGLLALLISGFLSGQDLVTLFQRAKQEIKTESWAEALKTLDLLDTESQKPGMENQRKQLEPPLALYRGVALANLGRTPEAREQFEAYLATNPNATLDSAVYSKKAIAAMDEARRSIGGREGTGMPSLANAYRSYQINPASPKELPLPDWADGPIRFLLTTEEKKEWALLKDSVSRGDFVEKFWTSRDPTPGTPQNEMRQEFERRVAFADDRFKQGETSGSTTDRGMVFILVGPPTYAGRKPIGAGDDASDSQGSSQVGRHDAQLAVKGSRTSAEASAIADRNSVGGTGKSMAGTANNWREVWHYRREVLPAGVPYQQVDFEFVTRKGYGENILQRDSAALATIEIAKKKMKVGSPPS